MAQIKTILEHPGIKVMEAQTFGYGEHKGYVGLKHGDKLGLIYDGRNHKNLVATFRVGTVIGYAVETYKDPLAELALAQERGHNIHWINGCGATITAQQRAQEVVTEVKVGMKVAIEGKRYEVIAEPNQNLGLKPIE